MIFLPNVTLIAVDCYNYGPAVDALNKSLEQIKPYKTLFLTDIDIELDGIEVKKIPKLKSKKDYSYFVLKELSKYFHTSHCLLIQHDGYVLNGSSWKNDFLKYDYIGAPWLYPDMNIGNGGFSLRSHRLQTLLAGDPFIVLTHPEDENIGRLYRDYLEKKYGILFPEQDLAEMFSYELREPIYPTFGFHQYHHEPYRPPVVIKRTGAMGDVIMAEPLMQYFYDKGYRVYLDTMVENMEIFFNHPFEIRHISQLNQKPAHHVNLDMSYENSPKSNVLNTYFKFANISLGKNEKYNRNSKLNVNKNASRWIFEKYVVFHIDETSIPHRNANGVNWESLGLYFQAHGYTVIQVGKNSKNKIGLHFYCENKPLLMYLLAGADYVIGIDSGICQLAVALGKKTIIMTGSVNLKLRYQDFSDIEVVKTKCQEEKNEFCYHNARGSVTGLQCAYNEQMPPCTVYTNEMIIEAFKKLSNGNKENTK